MSRMSTSLIMKTKTDTNESILLHYLSICDNLSTENTVDQSVFDCDPINIQRFLSHFRTRHILGWCCYINIKIDGLKSV